MHLDRIDYIFILGNLHRAIIGYLRGEKSICHLSGGYVNLGRLHYDLALLACHITLYDFERQNRFLSLRAGFTTLTSIN